MVSNGIPYVNYNLLTLSTACDNIIDMNAIQNKPELDPLQIRIDGEISVPHEVKRYGIYALKLALYAGVQIGKEIGECALILDDMLQPRHNDIAD